MSRVILCRSEYSKRPYYINGAGINVYSIEEICYFLYHDIYLVGADFFCEDLFVFIEKDIKEPELAQRLRMLKEKKAGMAELVLTILKYVDFYSDAEVNMLGNLIEKLDSQNVLERTKVRADNYLENKRFYSAITGYESIVYGRFDQSLGVAFYGNVWHNLGVCHAKLMNFSKAAECFREAYRLNENDDSKRQYFYAKHLSMVNSEDVEFSDENSEKDWHDIDSDEETMFLAKNELTSFVENSALNTEEADTFDVDRQLEEWQEEYIKYIR